MKQYIRKLERSLVVGGSYIQLVVTSPRISPATSSFACRGASPSLFSVILRCLGIGLLRPVAVATAEVNAHHQRHSFSVPLLPPPSSPFPSFLPSSSIRAVASSLTSSISTQLTSPLPLHPTMSSSFFVPRKPLRNPRPRPEPYPTSSAAPTIPRA